MLKLALLVVVAAVAAAGWFARGPGPGDNAPATMPNPTASAASNDQTLTITEADLNQRLSQRLVGQPLGATPLGTATLQRITTQLANGHLTANGDADVASTSIPVLLTASGSVENGKAVVSVDDLRAAGVPLPPSARQSVQQRLQAQLDDLVSQKLQRVTSITIANGALTLRGSHS